jgi:hypothetical protein
MGETRDLLKILNEHMSMLTIQADDDSPVAASSLVSNPANETHQKQKRTEPNGLGPTTKASKVYAKKMAGTRKASEKKNQFKNQGKTENGKNAY